jgi:hypothetical protein
MKFRKKPIIIEATQFVGTEADATRIGLVNFDPVFATAQIETLEGMMTASANDWIITGVHGERYPCKPDIFRATYERVEEFPEDSYR